jgi:gamma-glutamylcyclotransferase (GGCT)/AIG2-like uncharacterized protein YtfP
MGINSVKNGYSNISMEPTKLFVYGTLKPGEASYGLCAASVLELRPAIARGQLYHLPLGYPAMTLSGSDEVHGFLLSFGDAAILSRLDEYEQHAPEQLRKMIPPEHRLEDYEYQRKQIEVSTAEANSCEVAWAYTMPLGQVRYLEGILVANGYWSGRSVYRTTSPEGG